MLFNGVGGRYAQNQEAEPGEAGRRSRPGRGRKYAAVWDSGFAPKNN
ncbi:hypothetical protein [Clostridium sp. chh4-2]|nr:hypothetical protein [Clostridium sp. chh4-2]